MTCFSQLCLVLDLQVTHEAYPSISLCQLETFQEAGVDVRDMTRCYSGLHFMNTEELDAALKETHEQVSEVGRKLFKMRFAFFFG